MDLGATLCTRRKPDCENCPMNNDCQALAQNRVSELPTPKPKKNTPVRSTLMLLLRNEHNETLMQQRPPAGIWGGLWSFPELPADLDDSAVQQWCEEELGHCVAVEQRWPSLRHTFSHFHLDIEPIVVKLEHTLPHVQDGSAHQWHPLSNKPSFGVATPVKGLLEKLALE